MMNTKKSMTEAMVPSTTRQAFKILDGMLTDNEKASALTKSRFEFAADEHFGLGQWIRNTWYYGIEDEKTQEHALAVLLGPNAHYSTDENGDRHLVNIFQPDDLSSSILERYHNHLKRTYKKK